MNTETSRLLIAGTLIPLWAICISVCKKVFSTKTKKSSVVSTIKEVWVGKSEQVRYYALREGVKNPKIISFWHQSVGFRGPIKIHLCGQWEDLDEWMEIAYALKVIELHGDEVEWVEHRN